MVGCLYGLLSERLVDCLVGFFGFSASMVECTCMVGLVIWFRNFHDKLHKKKAENKELFCQSTTVSELLSDRVYVWVHIRVYEYLFTYLFMVNEYNANNS